MKKLLILLTLGLMFGQAKLETRSFDYNFSWNDATIEELDLYAITGHQLDYAIIKIIVTDYQSNYQWNSSISYEYLITSWQGYENWVGGGLLFYINGQNGNIEHTDEFMTYNGENSIRIKQTQTGGHSGYANIKLLITAEFPIEDTGYMEEDFDFCINEGLNLVSYPCENDIAINDALPSEISNNLSSIVGEGVAGVNVNGTWVGSLTQLQAGSGYWFKSSIEACFNYECAEN